MTDTDQQLPAIQQEYGRCTVCGCRVADHAPHQWRSCTYGEGPPMTDTDPPDATDSPRHMERDFSDSAKPETQDSHNPPNETDCTCMGCRHFREQAEKERLRSAIRSRKALYEGLAAIPDADECPECPGTMAEHYPDCGEVQR